MEISIIIPFYNIQKKLFIQCIDSIKSSTFTDYEVIIVDDGSEKEYKSVFRYIDNYKNFKVIEIENSGVSVARNYGTNLAKGKYITYVDADDCIAPDFLEHVYTVAEKTKSEIVFAGTRIISSEEYMDFDLLKRTRQEIKEYVVCSEKELCDLKEHMIDQHIRRYAYFDEGAYLGRGCYARLIKSELAKSVKFPANIKIGEDIIWHHRILWKNPVVGILFESCYFYRNNPMSVTKRFNVETQKNREQLSDIVLSEIGRKPVVYELIWQQFWAVIIGCGYSDNSMSLKEKNIYINRILKTRQWSIIIENKRFLSRKNQMLLRLVRCGCIFVYLPIYDNYYYPLKSKMRKIIKREKI